MKDKLLQLANNLNVDTGNTENVANLTIYGGQITFISNSIPTSAVAAYGTDALALEVVCASSFTDSSNVTMELISYSAGDLTSIGTALILLGYSSHWIAPTITNTQFITGKRMATVPLPPGRSMQAYLAFIMRFSAETAGRINVNVTRATTMRHSPPANAI